jgi:hypothetical protein
MKAMLQIDKINIKGLKQAYEQPELSAAKR